MLSGIALRAIELLELGHYIPCRIRLGSHFGFKPKEVDDVNAFSFFFFSIASTSKQVMKTGGSLAMLVGCLTTKRLSSFACLTPCTGSSVTGLMAGGVGTRA